MPARITPIDRIVIGIGISVDVDAFEGGIEGVGREETPEVGIEGAGMEIEQAFDDTQFVRRANDSLDRLLSRLTIALGDIALA